jgi:hypothetical protein
MSNLIKQKQVQGLVSDLAAKAADSAVVKKSNNLSDVNAGSARTNLGVYSRSEVDAMVAGAENAYSVATITARGALTGLKVADRVFVSNDGDSNWALYIVTAITNGNGSTSTFEKIADEDLFTNAISGSAVKAAYENNSNTNAYTDAEKNKLAHISVSQAVDLDAVESDLATTTTTASSALSTANSASSAASAAQSTANTATTKANTAQSTADGAVTDAAAAQSTANSASTAATAAQSTADSAASAASAAQSTANGKEEAFTQAIETFTGLSGGADTPILVKLEHPMATGFIPLVFFNGLQVHRITYNAGSPDLEFTVPYETEGTDYISVTYNWR